MDADRFALLSRSLDARSRRGALRAMGALSVAGLVGRLGVTPAEARKKKGRKKKANQSCPECTCPAPTTCAARDTCPARSCCECYASSFGPEGCRLGSPSTTRDELVAACTEVCGDFRSVKSFWGSGTEASTATYACSFAEPASGGQCVQLRCPI